MPSTGEPNQAADRMVRLQVESRDVRDARVLAALRRVPRHVFLPAGSRGSAYEDHPVGIGHGQTMSQPYIVALMTELLELRGAERVLEIGTGSGYQTAVLAELCASVYSVERIGELADRARAALGDLGYRNIQVRTDDGSEGWPEQAPFDRILVTAAAPAVPSALLEQVGDNGVIVLPVGDLKGAQELVIVRKVGSRVSIHESIGCRFVPLLGSGGFPDPGR